MNRKSSIYTKHGDRGETSLIGGRRVPKYHPRIEAYGSVDELMAHTSLLRDLVDEPSMKEELFIILEVQMATTSLLAYEGEEVPRGIPKVAQDHVTFLEKRIDEMDASLEPLTSFIIPGGDPVVSQAHVARTVCRRCERTILRLVQEVPLDDEIVQFYNRLSDYFFVLSRKIAGLKGIEQKPWKPML